jgi:hypothetical protein
MIDDNFIRIAKEDQISYKKLSGIFGIYDYFSKTLDINIDEILKTKCINNPIVRYLPNGEFLESDMHFVDKEVQRYLSKWE